MRMAPTSKGFRLHIGIFGRRNTGKSSLLNAITRQQVSLVSPFAGTTTDPVEKPMELLPLGPVLFIDTAGIDDEGALGELRVARTRQVFDRTDLGIIVTEAGKWGRFEERILAELRGRKTPVVVVFNKADVVENNTGAGEAEALLQRLKGEKVQTAHTSAVNGTGLLELREAMLAAAPADFINTPEIVADLVGPGEMAILVVPIDKEAPKGRLILPQVQAIRDLLDKDAFCMVVKERELRAGAEPAEGTAEVSRDRFAGVPESGGGHACERAVDKLFDIDGAVQGRSCGASGGGAGD